ncbi:MAG: hypothetical protein WAV09_04145 [Minisyncoccia bacterium]
METITIQRDKLGRYVPGLERPKWNPKVEIICDICEDSFFRWPSQIKVKRNICSIACYWKSKKGEKLKYLLEDGKFRKDIAEKISKKLTGKPQPHNQNEKHHSWKGKEAGYIAMHQWLRRKFGKANKCENQSCKYPRKNANGKIIFYPTRFEWAIIHGNEHDHERENYIQLCKSCHVRYDLNLINIFI